MKKIDNSIKITGIISLAAIIIIFIIISTVVRVMPTETVSANGVAEIEVMPDLVTINFNVETRGDTAAEAKDANAIIVDAVVAALMNEGFSREEIVTQNFNVYEEYVYGDGDWGRGSRESTGFKATHGIQVEFNIDKSDRIGGTVDSGIDNGAVLSYINFGLSTELQNEYKAEALKLAAQDARVKAEAIAEGLGSKVGRVVSTTSSNFNYYPRMVYAMEDSAATVSGSKIETDIQPGDQNVNAQVSVTYKLK